MAFQVWGLVCLLVFYLVVFLIGIFASRRLKKNNLETQSEDVMLAGRDLGLIVGMFSMTATWVDGGYINGAAEAVYTKGVLWCQGPFGYSISLLFAGFFYATKMRDQGYATMLDPFQEKYGARVSTIFYIPSLWGDMFCNAAILSALGDTVSVIIGLSPKTSIIISGVVATLYTLAGGMYSVTYTDVVELIFMFFGLWLCVPFCILNEHVGSLGDTNYWGEVTSKEAGVYADGMLLLILGGIPWQVYFQRVLSCKSSKCARTISYIACSWCLILAIPPVIIGIVARATDWSATPHGPISEESGSLILPICLLNLCPKIVAYIGLGAVAAAVMSSSDASILSCSSQFARNIYRNVFRPKASEREIMIVMRLAMCVSGALATLIAITVNTIYGLWYLAGDLVYVVMFPQLTCILYLKDHCNAWGASISFLIAIVLRLLGGEPLLQLRAVIEFPYFDKNEGPMGTQMFPFKTMVMLISFFLIVAVSKIADVVTERYFSWSEASSNISLVDMNNMPKSYTKELEEPGLANGCFEKSKF